jgi:membrane protein
MARGGHAYGHGRDWVERQDPSSRKGATVGWFRRYREADGQLYAVLLTAYIFITLVPAAVVMGSYMSHDPNAEADYVVNRLGLTGVTATFVHDLLTGANTNQLGATLLAVADVVIFGLGYGRVLQLAHARSWRLEFRKGLISDQARYAAVFLVLLGLVFLYLLESKLLAGEPSWITWALVPCWAVAFLAYFVWLPRLLLHGRVAVRDVVPGAILTVVALVGMRIFSSLLLVNWLKWYSKYYGGLGVVMALFFWLLIAASILVVAAALSPVLAERRNLLDARTRAPGVSA